MSAVQSSIKKKDYDVIIIGGGPAGLFAAHYLCKHSDLEVLIVDKGKDPLKRKCPITENHKCVKCKPCNILCGIGGAGLFSDGKLNFIHKLGKTDLTQFMSAGKAQELIHETEQIFNRFGMDGRVYPTDLEKAYSIRKRARCRRKHCLSQCHRTDTGQSHCGKNEKLVF